ncbi:MAG: nucleotide exchange factor GrpE [Acidobacteriota bacterium]
MKMPDETGDDLDQGAAPLGTLPDADEEIQVTGVEALPEDAPPPSATGDGEDLAPAPEPETTPGLLQRQGSGERAASLQARIAQLEEDLLRARADFENYRKRQERERVDQIRVASARLRRDLLPGLDNFKRAMDSEEKEETPSESFRDGIRLIYQQFLRTLEEAGLTAIRTEGEKFDPNCHEAVASRETTEKEADTILEELEPGYRFRDRLLKPARVLVAVRRRS